MTCTGFTAVRQSQIGHPEVSTTHRDGDKPGIFFPRLGHISTECKNTSQTAQPRRQLGGEDKVSKVNK
jgi:hypothetical protein